MALRTITLRGFKSIASLENFELRNINLLIGANGSGKSNFLSAFKFLAKVAQGNLQNYVIKEGGPDVFLHGSRKRTQEIFIELMMTGVEIFGSGPSKASAPFRSGGRWYFTPTKSNKLIIDKEYFLFKDDFWAQASSGSEESPRGIDDIEPSDTYFNYLESVREYHFHDTGLNSPIKSLCRADDNLILKENGQNLSAYIRSIKKNFALHYQIIIETIRMSAPFFGDFIIRNDAEAAIQLEWYERGDPDTPYNAHALSDGTLRFICLTTLLLQPPELLPDTIIIDEPELGLHPYAISLLAEMIKQVAETKQVVIATQSVELLNHFAPEDVVVADREGAATTLRRLNADDLSEWLKSYSLGELWQKNVLGGRPI